MAKKTAAPKIQAYEIDVDRVTRQAARRQAPRDSRSPMVRPLRIFTLDPSVSDRLGGIATVQVPYENSNLVRLARCSRFERTARRSRFRPLR